MLYVFGPPLHFVSDWYIYPCDSKNVVCHQYKVINLPSNADVCGAAGGGN